MAGYAPPLRTSFRTSSVQDPKQRMHLPSLFPASNDSVHINAEILQPLSNDVGHYLSWKDTDPKDYPEYLTQLIVKIAKAKRSDLLKVLTQNGISLDIQPSPSKTGALHRLVTGGDGAAVSFFLQHGVNPNIQDEAGKTPLYHAVLEGRKSLINPFLNHPETDPTFETHKGKCPLSCALYHKHLDIAELLLSDDRIGPSLQNEHVLKIRKIFTKPQSNGEKHILGLFQTREEDLNRTDTAHQNAQSAFDF